MAISIFVKGKETRRRFVEAGADLFQRHGYGGVGLAQLIELSGCPKGSFYYHFPGGKRELALAAIERSQEQVTLLLRAARDRAKTPAEFVNRLGRGLKRSVVDSDFGAGCPVAGFALELASEDEGIAEVCEAVYSNWIAEITRSLTELGRADGASAWATLILAGFEGAVVMARASRSPAPIATVAKQLAAVI